MALCVARVPKPRVARTAAASAWISRLRPNVVVARDAMLVRSASSGWYAKAAAVVVNASVMPKPETVVGLLVMLDHGTVKPVRNPVAVPLFTIDAPELIVKVVPDGTTRLSVNALSLIVLMTFLV